MTSDLDRKRLFRIFVPTKYGDTEKPIKTKHHKEWDRRVLAITGGVTINSPSKGKWIDDKDNGKHLYERIIPVDILCTYKEIRKIIEMTGAHYRQRAVMYCVLSEEVQIFDMRK